MWSPLTDDIDWSPYPRPTDAPFAWGTVRVVSTATGSAWTAANNAAVDWDIVEVQVPMTFGNFAVSFRARGTSGHVMVRDSAIRSCVSIQLYTTALSGGVAIFTTSALPAGVRNLSAVYLGDANFTTSTSATLPQGVYGGTTVALASASPSYSGQPVTFTALVGAVAPSTGPPTGMVLFRDGATVLGSAPLASGAATLTTPLVAVKTHSITAHYQGDAAHGPRVSSALSHVVKKGATQASVTSSAPTAPAGTPVTFTATVAVLGPAAGTPTGTVTFRSGTYTIGSAVLSGGVATLTKSTLSIRTHQVTVVYWGSSSFASSVSAPIAQHIQ